MDVGLAEHDTRVADQVSRREVVRAVDDDVVVSENLERIAGGQRDVDAGDLDIRVDLVESIGGGIRLPTPDVAGAVKNLALEVRPVDDIGIHDPEVADARGRE